LLGILLVLQILTGQSTTDATTSTTTTTTSTPTMVVTTRSNHHHNKKNRPVVWYESSQLDLERAAYIREILTQRLHHVSSGRRLRDVCQWIHRNHHHHNAQGGQSPTSIVSIHGGSDTTTTDQMMDVQFLEEIQHTEHNRALLAQDVVSKKTPFSKNAMHLGLVTPPNAPPNQYPGPPAHEVDNHHHHHYYSPTVLQLGLRTMKLGILFAPVMSTAGIAMVSRTFRQKVWYKWITNCIGNSGAAWIKWGQWCKCSVYVCIVCVCVCVCDVDGDGYQYPNSREGLPWVTSTRAFTVNV
jgi:hypothetical protein